MTNERLDDGLGALLADHQVFYQKLRGYHWNVAGPLFFGLHEKFEEMYLDAATKVDELAERLAARGATPPSTMARILALASLSEDETVPAATDMVRRLLADLESLTRSSRALSTVAGEHEDAGTVNLLDGIADEYEKTAWMLRAFLRA